MVMRPVSLEESHPLSLCWFPLFVFPAVHCYSAPSASPVLLLLQGSAQNLPLTCNVFPVGYNHTLFWNSVIALHLYLYCEVKVKVSVTQSCLTLPAHGLWPTRLLCPWTFPHKNTGVGYRFLLQGIFPTQGLNPVLPHGRQILYYLIHQRMNELNVYCWMHMCGNRY